MLLYRFKLFTNCWRKIVQWTKPAYKDLRIGFEVTMYFEVR